jgi:hypothetical protein
VLCFRKKLKRAVLVDLGDTLPEWIGDVETSGYPTK